jgi:esterase FrsA
VLFDGPGAGDALTHLIAPAAAVFADHGPQPSAKKIAEMSTTTPADRRDSRIAPACQAIDAWVKAITYHQVSAFAGHSPPRMLAYRRSRHLFNALMSVFAPSLDVSVEQIDIPFDGGRHRPRLPHLAPGSRTISSSADHNGLEDTVQELALPAEHVADDPVVGRPDAESQSAAGSGVDG